MTAPKLKWANKNSRYPKLVVVNPKTVAFQPNDVVFNLPIDCKSRERKSVKGPNVSLPKNNQ